MNYLPAIAAALFAMLTLQGYCKPAPYISAELASKHLIPGEETLLIVNLHHARPHFRPAAPRVPDTAINFVRMMARLDNNSHLTQSFIYRLRPAKTGVYTIPPISPGKGDGSNASQPIQFQVRSADELIRISTIMSDDDVLVGWFPEKTSLYQGEQCPVTLKIYAPQTLHLSNWGLPEPKKTNCFAWRFTPPSSKRIGRCYLDGIPYQTASYHTILSGISPGIASIGPSSLKLVAKRSVIDPRLGPRITSTPLQITLPKADFTILPLPAGAPSGFENAVGKFQLSSRCNTREFKDTDTVEVMLQVSGRGNLENIKAPQLTGGGWKIIDTSKITRGEERRFMNGTVTFRQLLRPDPDHQPPTFIPAYTFSFFNPESRSYRALETSPIPINIIPTLPKVSNGGSTPGESLGTPPADMRDILAAIEHPLTGQSARGRISKYWHAIPGLVCLIIILIAIQRKIRASSFYQSDNLHKKDLIKKISKASDNQSFYRHAGRFIELWLKPDDELNAVLAERDKLCFVPEKNAADTPVEERRKKEIIRLLTQRAGLGIILLFISMTCLPLHADSTRDVFSKDQYQQAIDQYLSQYTEPSKTPADILYNIGNYYYRLDKPGNAALFWRRALAQQPSHAQSRQNLRYIELKEGAMTPDIRPWQNHLTAIAPNLYTITLQASLWILLIITLLFIFLKPKQVTLLLIISFLMPVVAATSGLGLYFYPDTDIQTPFTRQAVCVENTDLYQEAHRQSAAQSLPPTSLLRIKSTRGAWVHVETPDGQQGWVMDASISPVLPGYSWGEL